MRRKILVGLAAVGLVGVVVALALMGGGADPTEEAGEAARASVTQPVAGKPGSAASSMAFDAARTGDGVAPVVGSGGSSAGSSDPAPPVGGDDPLLPLPPVPPAGDVVDDVVDAVCSEAEKADIAEMADDVRTDLEAEIATTQDALDSLVGGLLGTVSGQVQVLTDQLVELQGQLAAVDDLEKQALEVCEDGGDGLTVFP